MEAETKGIVSGDSSFSSRCSSKIAQSFYLAPFRPISVNETKRRVRKKPCSVFSVAITEGKERNMTDDGCN